MTFSPVSPYKAFGLSRRRGPSPDLLDYTLFLPSIWLVCGLAIALRLIGPLFVVILVGFCCFVNSAMESPTRSWDMLSYTATCALFRHARGLVRSLRSARAIRSAVARRL